MFLDELGMIIAKQACILGENKHVSKCCTCPHHAFSILHCLLPEMQSNSCFLTQCREFMTGI